MCNVTSLMYNYSSVYTHIDSVILLRETHYCKSVHREWITLRFWHGGWTVYIKSVDCVSVIVWRYKSLKKETHQYSLSFDLVPGNWDGNLLHSKRRMKMIIKKADTYEYQYTVNGIMFSSLIKRCVLLF